MTPVLRVSDLRKSFGPVEALRGADLELHAGEVLAVVGDSRNAASLGLHRSLGFVQVGLLPAVGYRPGGWVDAVLLQRRLGDDPPPGLAH